MLNTEKRSMRTMDKGWLILLRLATGIVLAYGLIFVAGRQPSYEFLIYVIASLGFATAARIDEIAFKMGIEE
jgi:hypothetical protein